MKRLPDPRLARIICEIDRVTREIHEATRHLDDLHAEVIKMLRDDNVAWIDIGDCYEPPKSRQAVSRWASARRHGGDGRNGRRTRPTRRGDDP